MAIDGGIPTGGLAENFLWGIGGNLRYIFYVPSKKSTFDVWGGGPITLSAGYYNIFTKDTSVDKLPSKGITMVPIMFGLKMPFENQYVATELGWAYLDQKNANSNFSIDIEMGLNFNKVDAGIKFLGLVGKDDFFLGFASFQLTYKFN